MGLPRMTDMHRLAAMEFLQCILLAVFNSPDPRMGVLIVSQMIQLSLDYGLCDVSAFAFAMFGSTLVRDTTKDLEAGYFYGTLSLKLLDVLGASRRFKARVFAMVYGTINIWRDPLQASLDNLLEGYDAGCSVGDLEYALKSANVYAELALYTGQDLSTLEKKMRTFVQRALQCNQVAAKLAIVTHLSAVLKLTGGAGEEDVYQLLLHTTEKDLFKLLESRNDRGVCFAMLNNQKLMHIFKGDMESAIHVYDLILNSTVTQMDMENIRTWPFMMGSFADGLIAFSRARKNNEDKHKWIKTGEDTIKTFKAWEEISKWNYSNKLYLLEAEYYRSVGNNDLALDKYSSSIQSAKKHRFVNEEGLAHIFCGQYHFDQGRRDVAQHSFDEAKRCYMRWGAVALISALQPVA